MWVGSRSEAVFYISSCCEGRVSAGGLEEVNDQPVGTTVTLKYKLPLTARIRPARTKNPSKEEFFTLYKLVEAGGIEPPSESLPSPRLHA